MILCPLTKYVHKYITWYLIGKNTPGNNFLNSVAGHLNFMFDYLAL